MLRPHHDIAAIAGAAALATIREDLRPGRNGGGLRVRQRARGEILRRIGAALPIAADQHRATVAGAAHVDDGARRHGHVRPGDLDVAAGAVGVFRRDRVRNGDVAAARRQPDIAVPGGAARGLDHAVVIAGERVNVAAGRRQLCLHRGNVAAVRDIAAACTHEDAPAGVGSVLEDTSWPAARPAVPFAAMIEPTLTALCAIRKTSPPVAEIAPNSSPRRSSFP